MKNVRTVLNTGRGYLHFCGKINDKLLEGRLLIIWPQKEVEASYSQAVIKEKKMKKG